MLTRVSRRDLVKAAAGGAAALSGPLAILGGAQAAAADKNEQIIKEEQDRRQLEREYFRRLQLDLRNRALGESERRKLKEEYCARLPQLEQIRIRPHHLLCLLCGHGQAEPGPSPKNHQFEITQRIQADPEVKIEIIEGTDNACIPCPMRVGTLCVADSAVRDLKKDHDVLERTGLRTGALMTAAEVYSLVTKRIPTVKGICTYEKQDPPVWKDCSSASRGFYENAIRKGLWP